jgi:hypothetical protein
MIDPDPLENQAVANLPPHSTPDLIELIPNPDTVRQWLAESIRKSDLLRSLLRLARRKAAYQRNPAEAPERPEVSRG